MFEDSFVTFTRFLLNYETETRAARPPGQQGRQGSKAVRAARPLGQLCRQGRKVARTMCPFGSSSKSYRDSVSVAFNSGQKMALRAFCFIRALTKALTYYFISRSLRHLLVAIENN